MNRGRTLLLTAAAALITLLGMFLPRPPWPGAGLQDKSRDFDRQGGGGIVQTDSSREGSGTTGGRG
jgi:hypothetical protein